MTSWSRDEEQELKEIERQKAEERRKAQNEADRRREIELLNGVVNRKQRRAFWGEVKKRGLKLL